MRLALRLLLALWAGALVAIAALAVPVLFHELGDRHLAGQLAGAIFRWLSYASLGAALAAAVMAARRPGTAPGWFLAPAALLASSEWGVRPLLEAARAAAGSGSRAFLTWHGVSSGLYALATVGVLWLLARELRR